MKIKIKTKKIIQSKHMYRINYILVNTKLITIIYTNYVLRIKSERIKVNCLRRYQKTKFLEIFIFEQFFLSYFESKKILFFFNFKEQKWIRKCSP